MLQAPNHKLGIFARGSYAEVLPNFVGVSGIENGNPYLLDKNRIPAKVRPTAAKFL
jgi:hypothetical protein